MSDSTTYTMYRKDSRGTIEVDLNDPLYSLDQLIEKQKDIVVEREERIQGLLVRIEQERTLLDLDEATLHRLEVARNAARNALGPSARERADSND